MRVRDIALILLSTGLALIGAEAGLRLLHVGESPYRVHRGDPMFQPDPETVWRSTPNSQYRLTAPEFDITIENNSRGFRGPEPEDVTTPCRVAIIGDSFVQGLTVSYQRTFGQVAQSLLPDCTVIANGVEGFNTVQETGLIADVAAYRPSLVILFFYYNDIWCNVSAVDCANFAVPQTPESPPSLLTRVTGRSRFFTLIREAVSTKPFPPPVRVFEKTSAPDIDQAWQATEAHLLTLADAVTQTGARLVVFYVPTREQVDPSSLDRFLRRHGRSEGDLNLRAVDDRLSAICQRRSLECVIPTERFQQAKGPLYLQRDSHWNVAGHRLVGQMIAELCCQSVVGQR